MNQPIDHSIYPDLDAPPGELGDDLAKADYLHRTCTAWDFGIPPDRSTFDLFCRWKTIFDNFPVITSPGYHAFRLKFGWPALAWPTGIAPPTAQWEHRDRIEGRAPDPCDGWV